MTKNGVVGRQLKSARASSWTRRHDRRRPRDTDNTGCPCVYWHSSLQVGSACMHSNREGVRVRVRGGDRYGNDKKPVGEVGGAEEVSGRGIDLCRRGCSEGREVRSTRGWNSTHLTRSCMPQLVSTILRVRRQDLACMPSLSVSHTRPADGSLTRKSY